MVIKKIMFFRFAIIILLILILPACSSVKQVTLIPEALQSTIEVNSSGGTPIPNWEGAPVMSGAIEGWLTVYSYVYSIDESAEKAEKFYMNKMVDDGWTLIFRQTYSARTSENLNISLNFERNKKTFNVLLVHNESDNLLHISLTLVRP